ncbi:MAG: hypothetical protein CSB24_04755 [Deltaproteobacteria bacterium]|nr:MAG: hypothetical protein CSB24_04755 [Deltaproteobacteria bacterium]
MESENIQLLYAPFAGMITELGVERGSRVRQGDKLAELASAELNAALSDLQIQKRIDKTGLELLFLRNAVAQIPAKNQEKLETESRLASLKSNAEQYQLYSAIDGMVTEWDVTLRPGEFVRKDQVFGRIIDPGQLYLTAYVPEGKILYPAEGDKVIFYSAGSTKSVAGTIRRIGHTRVDNIPYPALTSEQQGDIPVSREGERLVPLETRFLVEVNLAENSLKAGQSGVLRMKTRPVSTLEELWSRAYRIIIRESNF